MIEKYLAHPNNPFTVVEQEESRPGGFSEQKAAPVSKRKSTDWPPTVIIPKVPQVLLGWELVGGLPGTFNPNCLESLTPGAYT